MSVGYRIKVFSQKPSNKLMPNLGGKVAIYRIFRQVFFYFQNFEYSNFKVFVFISVTMGYAMEGDISKHCSYNCRVFATNLLQASGGPIKVG